MPLSWFTVRSLRLNKPNRRALRLIFAILGIPWARKGGQGTPPEGGRGVEPPGPHGPVNQRSILDPTLRPRTHTSMNTHTFCRRRRERLLSSGYGRPRRADGRGPRVACPGSRSEVAAAYSTRSSKGENRRPGRLPLRGRWYDIEGSPVYTAPMRARGIEPRSLPWRGSGLPLTDSRLSFEIGRVYGSNVSVVRRADDCREAASTRRWATNERRERLASALPLRYTPSVGGGVGGVEPPISRSKYLPSTVRPCGIPQSNGVLRC